MKQHIEDIRTTVQVKQTPTAKSARPLKSRASFVQSCMRPGKTLKDRKNDAHKTSVDNKQARAAWANNTSKASFPAHTCNGKRSRAIRDK